MWGEAGTMKVKMGTSTKIQDCGVHCAFVGYSTNHLGDSYHMWDPKTGVIRSKSNVVWLKCMYFNKPSNSKELNVDNMAVQFMSSMDNSVIQVGEGDNYAYDDDDSNEEMGEVRI
jgi:hypothetical protein